NPQGAGLKARPFRDAHPPHRRSPVGAGLGAFEERLQVLHQGGSIIVVGLPVHTRGTVFAGPAVGLAQPAEVQMVVERGKSQRRRLLRQLRYPLLFRGHGIRFLSTGHVSLQRFRSPAPPSLHRVPSATVPRLRGYYGALRVPANHHNRLPCRSPVITTPLRLSWSLRSGPTPAWGRGCSGAATPRCRHAGGVAGRPKFLGNPGVPLPCSSTPAGSAPPGPTVVGRGPRSAKAEGSPRVSQSRGSIARPQHSLSTLRPGPCGSRRKTHFRLRARLYRVGLLTHRVPAKGFRDAVV